MVQSFKVKNKEIGTNKRNLEKKSAGARHDDANVVHTMINADGDFCDVYVDMLR